MAPKKRSSEQLPPQAEQQPLLLPTHHHNNLAVAEEELCKREPVAVSWFYSTMDYLNEDLERRGADYVLLACYLLNGLVDAGAYNAWECFVGMMTGNTIFLALSLSALPLSNHPYAWTKSLFSIVSFFFGTLLFSAFHQRFGTSKRWTLALTFTLQTIGVIVSAALLRHGKVSESPAKPGSPGTFSNGDRDPYAEDFPWSNLIPIALLSFQASGKLYSSRLLGFPYLPTVLLTVSYTDLLSDPALLTAGLIANGPRNRRLVSAVLYFAGAWVGGFLGRSVFGFEGALWIASGGNAIIVGCWFLWRKVGGTNCDDR